MEMNNEKENKILIKTDGVIPSPPDERDYRVGASIDISNDFPEEFELWQPPVENQGQDGSCVAQSLANLFECWDNREGKKHRDYSVGFIYGTENQHGMVPRAACSVAIAQGDVYRSVWECLKENPDCYNERKEVSDDIKATAKHMSLYVRIYSIEELKAFMIKYRMPVMIIAKGSDYAWYASGGYHATACYGWDKDDMLLYTNSWGTGGMYGDGKGKMAFEKLTECWGLVPPEAKKTEFTDISGHWAEKTIRKFATDGIVNGYEDNTFRPNKGVTRAEVVSMMDRERNYDCERNSQMMDEKIDKLKKELLQIMENNGLVIGIYN